MRSKLLLDLDGTLIDCKQRLHRLFTTLAGSAITFDEYWEIKRQRITQADMLSRMFGMNPVEIDHFKKEWLRRVEEPALLAIDTPFPGVLDFLRRAAESHDLYIVTARQHPDLAREQIAALGMAAYVEDIVVTRQLSDKADAVRQRIAVRPSDRMVGDTGEDIRAGKALGVRTAAVLTGVLSAARLEEYGPDLIVQTVCELA